MPLYSKLVIDHFTNPRNAGLMPDADGTGVAENPGCGDLVKIYIRVNGGYVKDVQFQTYGCSAAIAASSMVTEMAKGKTLEHALDISSQSIAQALGGLPGTKMHCAVLAAEAVHRAVEDYRKKQK